jgi:hypothetical protein
MIKFSSTPRLEDSNWVSEVVNRRTANAIAKKKLDIKTNNDLKIHYSCAPEG